MSGLIKINFQYNTGKYTLLGVDSPLPPNRTDKVCIQGKEYQTEIVYDLPNHIAILGDGDFVGKEVEFI